MFMSTQPTIAMYEASAAYLREALKNRGLPMPRTAVILGSGLGTYAASDAVQKELVIPYKEIPHFPISTVSYQKGELTVGVVEGSTVLFFNGRFHYYEGWEMWQAAYPVAVCHLLGVECMLITNAAGGINANTLIPGDLVCVTDHIKLCAESPVRGQNFDVLGTRFFDMQSVYDKSLIAMAKHCAEELGFSLKEGVYAYMTGPQFETPAEIKALRMLGADLVGMSTVPEVIAAAHCQIRVLCISCVTNYAAGVTGNAMTEQEVLDTAAAISDKFCALLHRIIANMTASMQDRMNLPKK